MPTEPIAVFAAFALLLLALAWMSRRIGILIQENVYLLTGSTDLAMVVLFLVYLPGIVLHEGAHWVMAKLLGLKTGKFRVWPQKQGKYIGMGSVAVASGGPLTDSLVGLAPLLVGSGVVALIGSRVFGTQEIGAIWQQGDLLNALYAVFASLRVQDDNLLWAYLIFVIANAMMPSSSDREPLKSLFLYLLAFAGLYFLLDQSGQLLTQMVGWLANPVWVLTTAFLFTLILDIIILFLLYISRAIFISLRRTD
jgi:hypothetical protein